MVPDGPECGRGAPRRQFGAHGRTTADVLPRTVLDQVSAGLPPPSATDRGPLRRRRQPVCVRAASSRASSSPVSSIAPAATFSAR